MRCAVFGCNNHNKSNNFVSGEIRFHKFPKGNTSLWVNACCRLDKFNVVSARICSKHFKETDYEVPLRNKLLNYVPKHGFNLKCDAVPSLFLPKGKVVKRNDERENRIKKSNIRKFVNSNEEVNDKGVSTISSTTENIPSLSTHDCSSLGSSTSSKIVPVPVPRSLKTVGINTKKVIEEHKINALHALIEELKEKLNENQAALKRIFTDRQINKLKNPAKRPTWSAKEISEAIALHSTGPRAYRHLLKKGYPFPTVSTLKSWVKRIRMKNRPS